MYSYFTVDSSLMDLELSYDKTMVFTGGNIRANQNSKPRAIVSAVRFSKDLSILDEYEIVDGDAQNAFTIKRTSSAGIIFVGCYKSVYVLEFVNNKFALLMIAVDLHSSRWGLPQVSYSICAYSGRSSTQWGERTSSSVY